MSFEYDPNKAFKLAPEGPYTFFVDDYEKRRTPNNKPFILFRFTAVAPNNQRFKITQAFWVWEERWKDLLLALGGEEDAEGKIHLPEEKEEIIGLSFEGEIQHEPDKKNAKIMRSQLVNIKTTSIEVPEVPDVPRPDGNEDKDGDEEVVPF